MKKKKIPVVLRFANAAAKADFRARWQKLQRGKKPGKLPMTNAAEKLIREAKRKSAG